jgi:hypothetical protein
MVVVFKKQPAFQIIIDIIWGTTGGLHIDIDFALFQILGYQKGRIHTFACAQYQDFFMAECSDIDVILASDVEALDTQSPKIVGNDGI